MSSKETVLSKLCVKQTDGFEWLLHKNRNRCRFAFLCNKYFCNADDSDDFMIPYGLLVWCLRSMLSCHRHRMGTKPGMWCSSFPRGPEKRMQKGETLHEVLLQCTSKSTDVFALQFACICQSWSFILLRRTVRRGLAYWLAHRSETELVTELKLCLTAFQERSKTIKALNQTRHGWHFRLD